MGKDIDHPPFMDLPQALQPDASPWDVRLSFNTLAPDQHRQFMALMNRIRLYHGKIYNKYDVAAEQDTSRLYEMAIGAGIRDLALEIGRQWGVTDKDGPYRMPGCDRLRCWPDIESTGPHSVQILLAHKKPTMLCKFLPLGGGETLTIQSGGYTVMSDDGKMFKPGDWVGSLLTEYARLKEWRETHGDDCRNAPRPATTLPPAFRVTPT